MTNRLVTTAMVFALYGGLTLLMTLRAHGQVSPAEHIKDECNQMFIGNELTNIYEAAANKKRQKECLAHATLDACCQFAVQQLWYCKAWADDPEHMKTLPPHPISVENGFNMDCPWVLTDQSKNLVYFRAEASKRGWSLTAQEVATAKKVVDYAEQKAKEREAEEAAAREQQLHQGDEELERANKAEAELQAKRLAISGAIWKQIGPSLHKGASQQQVKAVLAANGFKSRLNDGSVWECGKPRLQADGYNWINECLAFDRTGRGLDMLFVVARRLRDPDTGAVRDEMVEKLLDVHYDDIADVKATPEDLR